MNTTTTDTATDTNNTTPNNTTREQRYNYVHENNTLRMLLSKVFQEFSADYYNIKAIQAEHKMSQNAAKKVVALGKLLHKEHAVFITEGKKWSIK